MSILPKSAPMSGMGMMLKSFGIDVPALEKQFTTQMSALVQYAKEISEKLSGIQTRLSGIEERLSQLEEKQSNVGSNVNSNGSSD